MILYYSPNSPYVRKVMVLAIELGIEQRFEKKPTDVWSAGSIVRAANPLGRIPTLVTDEGAQLYDSPVICEYLAATFGSARLLPASGNGRWQVLRRQALGDGLIDAAVQRALEIRRRPEALRWSDWIDHQKAAMLRTADALEKEAGELCDEPDLGTVAIGCGLGYWDARFGDDRWRDGRPALAAWFDRLATRRSFRETAPAS